MLRRNRFRRWMNWGRGRRPSKSLNHTLRCDLALVKLSEPWRYLRLQGASGAAEVPALVVDVDEGHVVAGKRHVFVAADLNDETFAGHNLIEVLTVFKGDGYDLIAHAGFALALEVVREFAGDGNQMLPH